MSLDSLLKKATSNDDNAPPGYVFVELGKLTLTDIANCDKMADWLADKIKKNEPAVKWKVLLTIKQVAKAGRPEFRRIMQRHKEAIKQCSEFRGPPDPLRGNEPYKRVQDAAKEALEAIFDSSVPTASAGVSNRFVGMGSGGSAGAIPPPLPSGPASGFQPGRPYGGPQASGGSGINAALPGQPGYDPNSPMHAPPVTSGTMQGFGNYNPEKDKSTASAILGKITSAFSTTPAIAPIPGRPADYRGGGAPGIGGPTGPAPVSDYRYASNRPGAPYNPSAAAIPAATASYTGPSGAPHAYGSQGTGGGGGYTGAAAAANGGALGGRARGAPGGAWGAPAPAPAAFGGQQQAQTPPAAGGMGQGTAGPIGRVGGMETNKRYERGLVEELTAPGGVRAVPDKDKLANFLSAARTLEVPTVAGLLDERLALALPGGSDPSSGPSIATKALLVIEAVAASPGCEALKAHLTDHCDVLLELLEAEDVKLSVRTGAAKALRALGVDAPHPPAVAASLAGSGASASNALSYSSPAPAPAAYAPAAVAVAASPAPAPVAAAHDLLGFDLPAMSAPAAAPTPSFGAPAPLPSPLFAAPQQQQQPAGDGGGLFGEMMTVGGSGAASTMVQQQQPVQQQQQQQQQALASMFGGLSIGAPAPAPVAPMQQFSGMAPAPSAVPVSAPQAQPSAAPANSLSALQAQSLALSAQMQQLMMQASSPGVSGNPAAQAQVMQAMMALQAQQTGLMGAMAAAQAAPQQAQQQAQAPQQAQQSMAMFGGLVPGGGAGAVPMGSAGGFMGAAGPLPGGFGAPMQPSPQQQQQQQQQQSFGGFLPQQQQMGFLPQQQPGFPGMQGFGGIQMQQPMQQQQQPMGMGMGSGLAMNGAAARGGAPMMMGGGMAAAQPAPAAVPKAPDAFDFLAGVLG